MPDEDGHPAPEEMDLGDVLSALADGHRRRVILTLLAEPDGTERHCSSFGLPVSKATRTHHFRVLRQAGLVRQVNRGNSNMATLRRADLEQRFPGLLDVLRREAGRPGRPAEPQ
ncbi:helix-turn-helix domain-containing protein [Streptomyces sp. NBC_01443]|uniref:ArsR/SmtB family transcription factor n=1 Tax=Streptomyces sp. NBC_01443 TaxID=2903868 RepID=UPI0022523A24|nr:helix-turn-helix domain-containing protein [Streptomyces sp. NBC_01443]MCX4629408.1 ArsR family transcriptional regulator [Streptomyces sp. NBC_01443]